MKRHRRKGYKRRGRLLWKLQVGLILMGLAGISVFLWQNSLTRAELSKIREPLGEYLKSQEPGWEPEFAETEQEMEPRESKPTEEELFEQEIEAFLEEMTLEEKIYQMFIITPEQLTGTSPVTAAGETTKNKLKEHPVGGLIYFAQNLISEEQTKEMLANTMEFAEEIEDLPIFLCVDEEGGRVARVGKNPAFQVEQIQPMGQITDEEEAYRIGTVIGGYLRELGFNVDFAPDADVITNEKNTAIGDRSFGSDPQIVTHLAIAVSNGLHAEGIMSTFKHFPGHGATEADTHQGYAYGKRTYEELMVSELVPFAAANENGVDMIMVAHISFPDLLGDDTPSSLSYQMITEVLRGELEYDGLVVTDALNMGAIAENYSSDEAAVKAVEAGVDLLLMPKDFTLAYEGIMGAVLDGRISEERINESVGRILRKKLEFVAK